MIARPRPSYPTGNPGSDVLSTQATYTTDDFGRRLTQTDANSKTTPNKRGNKRLNHYALKVHRLRLD